MISKNDLITMQNEMVQNNKVILSDAIDPLKDKVRDLHERVGILEKKPATSVAEINAWTRVAL